MQKQEVHSLYFGDQLQTNGNYLGFYRISKRDSEQETMTYFFWIFVWKWHEFWWDISYKAYFIFQ